MNAQTVPTGTETFSPPVVPPLSPTTAAPPLDGQDAAPSTRSNRGGEPLRPNRPSQLKRRDLFVVVGLFAAYVVAIWIIHGGIRALGRGSEGFWTSTTQLTGLVASACGLIGLLLIARPRWIERLYGMDRLFVWHRVLGDALGIMLALHVVTGVGEYATGSSGVLGAIRELTGRETYMAGAFVGALLLGLVTISSLKAIRRRLSYESWYFVHLLAYVGFAISFGHEIVLGGSLSSDRQARSLWVGMHVAVLLAIVVGRFGPAVLGALRPLRVVGIARQNAGVSTFTIGGQGLERLRGEAGQFFIVRPMRKRLWWQAHPFSLSAAPTLDGLNFTIKDRGDATGELMGLPVGARVAVEGPYGVSTVSHLDDRSSTGRFLFVAGGVGIAPVKALLERLDPAAEPVVLFRAHDEHDLVHLADVQRLVTSLGGVVHTVVGPTARFAAHDPFAATALTKAVPDIATRTAVLCGPERLIAAARNGLKAAGMPADQIHYERAWW